MTTVAAPGIPATAAALRRLYFVRFAFALVWALVVIPLAGDLTPLVAALFVLYPLFDVAAAVYDARVSRTTGSPALLHVNVAVSLLAAAGLAVAATSGVPAVLRVWGAWAVVAGLVQLFVGLTRRRSMGGQWPMILSGGLSVLAGGSFVASAAAADPALANAAGYAIPGAVFFLIAAVRLGRAPKGN